MFKRVYVFGLLIYLLTYVFSMVCQHMLLHVSQCFLTYVFLCWLGDLAIIRKYIYVSNSMGKHTNAYVL